MLAKILSRVAWKSVASTVVLAAVGGVAGLSSLAANATTVATFSWVSTSSSGGVVTPSGTLTLSLPDTITTQTFDTGTLGSSSAAFAMLTGLSYTYGNGLSIGLADVTSKSINPIKWYTSATTNTNGASPGPGVYLLAGFQLSGSKVFAGDPRAAIFTLGDSAGTQNLPGPSILGPGSNGLTPFVGPATSDAGYWQLTNFQTGVSAVPVPAALPLLISGLAGVGGMLARRRRASAAV
jgi:hypothetical protein